jgi:hypothetical protein
MNEPTIIHLKSLYISYTLTNIMFKPIHIVQIDERTNNLFILVGHQENIEIEIAPDGEIFS